MTNGDLLVADGARRSGNFAVPAVDPLEFLHE